MAKKRHLLDIRSLNRERLDAILEVAERETWRTDLKKRIALAFFEASTRTSLSFKVAAELTGCTALEFNSAHSSMEKGESLENTLLTIAQMRIDAMVIRHPVRNAPQNAALSLKMPIINAGDGGGDHPTQALADMLTLKQRFGKFSGLTVVLVGDLRHSRVARSLTEALIKYESKVRLVTPKGMSPLRTVSCYKHELVNTNYKILENAIEGADVIYPLRVHFERREDQFPLESKTISKLPEVADYFNKYGIKSSHLDLLSSDGIVMHAGPANVGVEIESNLMTHARMVATTQVANGVAVRAAVFNEIFGGDGD